MADRAKWSLLPVCSIVTNFAKIILRLNIFESGKKDISKMNMLSKTKNLKPTYAIKLILEIKINNFSLKAAGFVRPITGQWQTGSSQFCISSPSSWSSCTHSKNQICTGKRCMPPIQPPKWICPNSCMGTHKIWEQTESSPCGVVFCTITAIQVTWPWLWDCWLQPVSIQPYRADQAWRMFHRVKPKQKCVPTWNNQQIVQLSIPQQELGSRNTRWPAKLYQWRKYKSAYPVPRNEVVTTLWCVPNK